MDNRGSSLALTKKGRHKMLSVKGSGWFIVITSIVALIAGRYPSKMGWVLVEENQARFYLGLGLYFAIGVGSIAWASRSDDTGEG